ncbi:MAG: RecQ family ATP-dependent DNA helicase [Saprospirales bacterium]|nr:MAG: RecQ family ATP-dependent DNA helicase [Saprospirales bacterium]
MANQAVEVLRKYWGYPGFRPLQQDIIDSILEGNDTIALLPTGGGKSICYQVPGLMMDGLTMVITPLIALMRDQVRQLKDRNIPAIAIHSGLRSRDIDRELANCAAGMYKFLYCSPERLHTDMMEARIGNLNLSQLVVDEAHCISQWGYDFRPSYLEIAHARELVPGVPCMALTATATQQVRKDIATHLQLKNPRLFVKTFKRDNIGFFVVDEENRFERLLYFLRRIKGTKIIYVRNRRKTREISEKIARIGFSSTWYHAGLEAGERARVEDQFIKGEREIIVSTNAFGMGIDKSDVRAVFHMDLPTGPEEYYQEAGRAGRDGKESYAILFCRDREKRDLVSSAEAEFPPPSAIKRIYKALCVYFNVIPGGGAGETFDFDLQEFTERFHLQSRQVYSALKLIEKSGFILLSEAVYHPPRVGFVVNNETLYDYQLKHPKMDALSKVLLRMYEGMFSISVPVHLKKIAKRLKTEPSEVHKALVTMEKDGIISYTPASDKPRVTFLEPRISSRHFNIDREQYDFLKKRTFDRVQGMLSYVEETSCRMQNLLGYFDEKSAEKCGKCDLCYGAHQTEPSSANAKKLKAHFEKLLSKKDMSLEDLLASVGFVWRKRAISLLKYMEAEGMVEWRNEKFSLKK